MNESRPPFPTSRRVRAAWAIALVVDGIQALTAAAELAGPVQWAISAGVDVLTMALLWWLLGWHFAFLPSLFVELVPLVDLAPTWTAAVYLATHERPTAALPTPRGENKVPLPVTDENPARSTE